MIVFTVFFVFLYYIFSTELRFNKKYISAIEENSKKRNDKLPFITDYFDTNDHVVKVSEYKNPLNKKNTIINITRRSSIQGFNKVYAVENLSAGIGQVIDYGAKPEVINHKIASDGQIVAFAFIYKTNNYNDKELNYNYLGFLKYDTEDTPKKPVDKNLDDVQDYLLLRTKREIEIVNLINKNDEFVLFYTVKLKTRGYELIGRKELIMQRLNIESNGNLNIKNPQKVIMPDYLSMYEIRILNEDDGYTVIYRARINEQRGSIDILISKMDNEGNIYHSTDVPIETPRGVFNDVEVAKTSNSNTNTGDTYTIAFSYTNLIEDKSSVVLLLFDRDGNLNPVPYVKLDPYKAESDVPRDISIIQSNETFFVFYNYKDYGYFISGVNTDGSLVLPPSRIAEPDKNYNSLSAVAYNDYVIISVGNKLRAYSTTADTGLSSDYISRSFHSVKILPKKDSKTDMCLYDDGLAFVWVRDILSRDVSYTGLLPFDKLFK